MQLLESGMSEALVIKTVQSQGQAYQLTPAEMLKLQQAGASEALISAMLDPSAGATSSAASAPSAATAPAPEGPPPERKMRKRRLAVIPFEWAGVQQWVHYWFGRPHNIGEGIRAMLTARMHQAKNVVLVERAQMDEIQAELALSNSNQVNQGTKVKTGRLSAADMILMGDIIIFGRDDKTEKSKSSSSVITSAIGRFGFGKKNRNRVNSLGQMTKEEKAVVAIALRIVDTETGEVLETAEARGESSRTSKNWDEFVLTGSSSRRSSETMTSSNFQATIIGEATSNAVDQVIAFLDERAPNMPLRVQQIEGRVAAITNGNPILSIGANRGVMEGDRFDILKILGEIVDPVTKEVLDVNAQRVGEMVVTEVRGRVSLGSYSGEPLLPNHEKGYTARLIAK